jgi:hypothetical protein
VRTPEQIALEVISQFPWSDNVVYRGALVGKQHAVAKTIADAIREDRAECKTNFFDESIPEPLILNTETRAPTPGAAGRRPELPDGGQYIQGPRRPQDCGQQRAGHNL